MVSLSTPRPLTTLGASRSTGPFDEVRRVYGDFATALPQEQLTAFDAGSGVPAHPHAYTSHYTAIGPDSVGQRQISPVCCLGLSGARRVTACDSTARPTGTATERSSP